jgi:hypothetical protein
MTQTVYVIVRDAAPGNYGPPEVDVFDTAEAADEQLQRLGGADFENIFPVQEQLVYDEAFADESE